MMPLALDSSARCESSRDASVRLRAEMSSTTEMKYLGAPADYRTRDWVSAAQTTLPSLRR